MLKEMKKGNSSGKQESAQGDEERTTLVGNRRMLKEMKKGQFEWETGECSRR